MGNCVAGGGYLPVLCDKLLMTDGSGLYLAGPALVKSAIGQEVSQRRAGRRGDARPGQRHDRLSRPERRGVPRRGCGGWWRPCGPIRRSLRRPFARVAPAEPPARPADRSRTISSAPIRATTTKFATCSIAWSTPALRRIQGRVRPVAGLRHGAAGRFSRRHRRQSASSRAAGRRSDPIRRRAVCRQRRKGGPVRDELQSRLAADLFLAGCQRLHGRPRQRSGRASSRPAPSWSTPSATAACRSSR